MPQPTQSAAVSANAVEDTVNIVNRFLAYVQEPSIQLQLLEQIAQSLPISSDETPRKLLSMAFRDVFNTTSLEGDDSDDWMTVSLLEIVDGAPSLEFLVRHARSIDRQVLPLEVIPSEDLVAACLIAFHERMPQAEEVLKKPEEWLAEVYPGAAILDPDGWRNDGKSFDEPITCGDFERRFQACTIRPAEDSSSRVRIEPT